jgi:Flp pilus assembly protein TadG
MIEFVLVVPVFLTLAFGLTEYSHLEQNRSVIVNAARDGVRYASLKATAWDGTATPASDTIQGEILSEGATVSVANTNTDVAIKYYTSNAPTFTTTTQCGHYRIGTGYVADNGLTQAQCTAAGQLVAVTVSHRFYFTSPLQLTLPGGVVVGATEWGTIQ